LEKVYLLWAYLVLLYLYTLLFALCSLRLLIRLELLAKPFLALKTSSDQSPFLPFALQQYPEDQRQKSISFFFSVPIPCSPLIVPPASAHNLSISEPADGPSSLTLRFAHQIGSEDEVPIPCMKDVAIERSYFLPTP